MAGRYPVKKRFSNGYLIKAGEKFDKIVESLKTARLRLDSEDEAVSEKAWDELSRLTDARTPVKFVRKLRKRTGSKNFDAAALILVDIAIGNFQGFESDDHNEFMRTMMGIKKINVGVLSGLLAWLKNSVEEPLIDLSTLMSEQLFAEQLNAETEASLDDARKEFCQLFFGLSAFSESIFHSMNIKLPAF